MRRGADEARTLFQRERPALAILARRAVAGSTSRARSRPSAPETRVILVVGRRLSGEQMREVAASGCDELLIAPMTADELLRRRGDPARRAAPRRRGLRRSPSSWAGGASTATVSNLSVDGVRLVVSEPIAEGQAVQVSITPEGEAPLGDPRHRGVGAAARGQDRRRRRVRQARRPRARGAREADAVAGHRRDGERIRVVLRGDFTEATRFDELLPAMIGRVVLRHRAGHVHELARRARVVRVPAPRPDPGLRVPRLLGAVHPAGVDGARRDRPRHGDVVLRAVPLHRLRSPGGAAAPVGGDPRVGAPSRRCSSARAAAAPSSSTTCPSATSRSSTKRRPAAE